MKTVTTVTGATATSATNATAATASVNALEAETWCNDCGMPLHEGQECPAYGRLYQLRDGLREILETVGVELKTRDGVNVIIVDADGHEVGL